MFLNSSRWWWWSVASSFRFHFLFRFRFLPTFLSSAARPAHLVEVRGPRSRGTIAYENRAELGRGAIALRLSHCTRQWPPITAPPSPRHPDTTHFPTPPAMSLWRQRCAPGPVSYRPAPLAGAPRWPAAPPPLPAGPTSSLGPPIPKKT